MRNARVRWSVIGAAVVSGALLGWTISMGCGRRRCVDGPLDGPEAVLFAVLGAALGFTLAYVLIRLEMIRSRAAHLGGGGSRRAELVVLRADEETREFVHVRARDRTPADMFLRIEEDGLRFTTPEAEARDLTTLRWDEIDLVTSDGSDLRILVGDTAWGFTVFDDTMGEDRVLSPRETRAVATRLRRMATLRG